MAVACSVWSLLSRPELQGGDAAQLVIDQGEDLLRRLAIAGAPLLEPLRDAQLACHAIQVYEPEETETQ